MNRGYTTWENEFLSDRWELHDSDDKLSFVVDKVGGSWTVTDAGGTIVAFRPTEAEAKKVAEALLP